MGVSMDIKVYLAGDIVWGVTEMGERKPMEAYVGVRSAEYDC